VHRTIQTKTFITLLFAVSLLLGQSIFPQKQDEDLLVGLTANSTTSAISATSSNYSRPSNYSTVSNNSNSSNPYESRNLSTSSNVTSPAFSQFASKAGTGTVSINLVGEEENYILGPGDQLTALVLTTQQEEVPITITSSGHAVIPNVGTISVDGFSLASAQDTIQSLLKARFRNAEIVIFLTQAKQISVPVYGEVTTPGVYTVDGTTRLTELIALAGGLSLDANPRAVQIENVQSRNKQHLDLYRAYRIAGEEVPFIQSGDRLFVSPKRDIVTLNGAVNYPLEYDYVENETVADLIAAAGGFSRDVDSSRILVTRFINDRDSIVRFELDYHLAESFTLQKDDYVFVPEQKDYRITRQVTITGEVTYPGRYAVREDKTHLIDLIGLAGGLTDDAYLVGSRIERTDFTDAGADEYEKLLSYNASDLSPEEMSYLKYRGSSLSGRVSLDFVELLNNGEELNNIILRNGDEIHIARRGLSVNVMGAVLKPGLIVFQEGENMNYYINQAGGLKDDAENRRIKVIKGGTGIWLEPRQVEKIEVGDAIWIPEEPYVDRLLRTKDILAIVGSVAATVLATLTVVTFIQSQ